MTPNLVDMRKSPMEKKHEMEGEMAPDDYPHGLCIHLMGEQIAALGLQELPEIGEKFNIMAIGVVTAASAKPSGAEPMLSIHLTALQLEPTESEEESSSYEDESPKRGPSTVLGNSYRTYG